MSEMGIDAIVDMRTGQDSVLAAMSHQLNLFIAIFAFLGSLCIFLMYLIFYFTV